VTGEMGHGAGRRRMRGGRFRRNLTVVAATTVAALALAACAGGTSGEGAAAGESAAGDGACAGARTAESTGWIEPIADDPEPQLPVTVTDFTGDQITVEDTSRILALDTYGTLATTVYALGLGDSLVGRDVSTGIPELMDLPLVTHNGHELNAEAILDLNPSVILTDYSIGPLEVQLQLKDSGIPVVILDGGRSRAVIGEQINAVAEVLGVPEVGVELAAAVQTDVAAAEAEIEAMLPVDPADRIRMVFLYMRGTAGVYYWFGEGSGADDLIEALGGVDVATEVGLAGARPINAEGLVKSEPDMYLMMSHGLESVGGIDGLLEVPGVGDTTAGINGCVVDMIDYEILSFGPQFPSTLRALGKAVYGSGSGGDAET
jgi:iron complex transport system substrate-binding protein